MGEIQNSDDKKNVFIYFAYFHLFFQCIFGIVFTFGILLGNCSATLDLSNLHVNDFQFFRYQQKLPNGELRQGKPPPPSLDSHIQHAKAGSIYF